MEIGKRIARGQRADVYESRGYAVKIFHPGYDKALVFYEAAATALVEKTFLPIAKVHEVLEIGAQMAIRMDYLPGPTLHEQMYRNNPTVENLMQTLVDQQLQIHAKEAMLPFNLKDNLRNAIEVCGALSKVQRARLLSLLKGLPRGKQLCHGNFHGANVIKGREGYFIVDWMDACIGSPDGDVCKTYMLYALKRPDLAKIYLETFLSKTARDRKSIFAWLPVLAAARLTENKSDEKGQLMLWVRGENFQEE
jgi:hypothetical protein